MGEEVFQLYVATRTYATHPISLHTDRQEDWFYVTPRLFFALYFEGYFTNERLSWHIGSM